MKLASIKFRGYLFRCSHFADWNKISKKKKLNGRLKEGIWKEEEKISKYQYSTIHKDSMIDFVTTWHVKQLPIKNLNKALMEKKKQNKFMNYK